MVTGAFLRASVRTGTGNFVPRPEARFKRGLEEPRVDRTRQVTIGLAFSLVTIDDPDEVHKPFVYHGPPISHPLPDRRVGEVSCP